MDTTPPIPPDPNSDPLPPSPGAPPPPPAPEPIPASEPPPAAKSFLPGIIGPVASPVIASTPDERMWAMIIHLSCLVGFVPIFIHIRIPGASLLIPLVIWLVKRDGSAFINDQGKEAVNFQIAATIVSIILILTCVGIILLPFLCLAIAVFAIIAGLKAKEGVAYRYPVNLRLIK